jgi:hypothetical protein
MKKFEYKVLEISAMGGFLSGGGVVNFQAVTEKLNELGREGWEAIGATNINRDDGDTRTVMIILKRPLNDTE